MTRELDKNASIHRLFESAGRSIPDLDGHSIRVAARKVIFSKLAGGGFGITKKLPDTIANQIHVLANHIMSMVNDGSIGINNVEAALENMYHHTVKNLELAPVTSSQEISRSKIAQLMPPSATPEQVAQWQAAQPAPGSDLIQPPPTSQTERELAQLMQQQRSAPAPTAPAGVPAAVAPAPLPPPVTPEQVAQWNKPHTYEEWEEQIRHPQQMSPPQQPVRQQPARPTGAAHVQRPAPRPAVAPAAAPAAQSAPMFDLRQTMQSPTGIMPQLQYTPGPGDPNYVPPAPGLNYTPGPFDANYTGASKNIQGLLKIADYLSKKKS
jgi:hypothetical protein